MGGLAQDICNADAFCITGYLWAEPLHRGEAMYISLVDS